MAKGAGRVTEKEGAVSGEHATVPLPPRMDPDAEHYPFCIVWTPIPLLSWILPFVGHVGICDSVGRIYDFEGPYHIGVDRMLFGNPAKYWDISKTYAPTFYASGGFPQGEALAACVHEVAEYDAAVQRTTKHFRKTQVYNFFTNNCHSFVACVLKDNPKTAVSWGMLRVCAGLALHGRYVSTGRFLQAHLPFFIIVAAAVFLSLYFRR